jgi:hypothetical protein
VRPTHALKMFIDAGRHKQEVSAYEKVANARYVARIIDQNVECVREKENFVGFAIRPWGDEIGRPPTTDGEWTLTLKKMALQIGTALGDIHEVGVIHRDVTPHNIILAAGSFYLIDFGCAKTKNSPHFDPQHSFIGTRRWASIRRQTPSKRARKFPEPSFLDDWESLFLTLVDLAVSYDAATWCGFQSFNPKIRPALDSPSFLVDWYAILVKQQKTLEDNLGVQLMAALEL